MRSLGLAKVAVLVAGIGALAAAPALADTFTLNVSLASSGTVNQPIVITATGNDPTDGGALYLEIDAIPTTLTTTCPTGYLNGSQLAAATSSGQLVAFDQREDFDASGNFSNVNAFTPNATGQYLLCSYTDDGAGDTLATSTMTTSITAATAPVTPPTPPVTPQASKPVDTTKPRVTRSGNTLSCSVGRWANAPQKYSYRWLVARKVKSGAHGRTLGSAHKLRGRNVQCSVTASNSAGSTTATSTAFKVH
jgi:hypothetical protein